MWFSVYENKVEKRIDKYLSRVKRGTSSGRVQNELKGFLLESPIELILWLEYKYKGYKFLKKKRRAFIYDVSYELETEFLEYRSLEKNIFSDKAEEKMRVLFPVKLSKAKLEKMWEMLVISSFLKSKYTYRESSAFWKLFPLDGGKMIGDCNQIVAVYMWLFGLNFDMDDLKLKHWPGHVCLHLEGFDFEATVGEFKNYSGKGEVIGIENIIPMNLLDIDDPDEKTWDIGKVKFAQMTVLVSKFDFESEVVKHNLQVAYIQVGVLALNNRDWRKAREFFGLAGDDAKVGFAWESEIRWLVDNGKLKAAMRVATKYGNDEFLKYVREKYCVSLLKRKAFEKAGLVAKKLGKDWERKCWIDEFNYLRGKVDGVNDLRTMKSNKKKYQRMLSLARKLKDGSLEKSLKGILKQIK